MNCNQADFRKKHSTVDNIFVLHILAEYYKIRSTQLVRAFIYFRKACDSIWRVGLWYKLLKYIINGKILTVVKNMYNNIKSCISINGEHLDYFQYRYLCLGPQQGFAIIGR